MHWPTQQRNLFCTFPLKTSLKMQKKSLFLFFAEALQESVSKITGLCTHKHRDVCSHTHGVGIKESYRSAGQSWKEKIQRFDPLKMLECYSNGMDVVLDTYKKGGRRAERMINSGYQRERDSVAMHELKMVDASLLDEMLYYGVIRWICVVQGRGICLAGHLHGLLFVWVLRGLRDSLSSI